VPKRKEFRDWVDVEEFATMCAAGFPEPKTFSTRVARLLAERVDDFDVVHDNQVLGYGMLKIEEMGLPLVTTIHHPITFDRRIDIAQTRNPWRKFTLSRWYGFPGCRRAWKAHFILTPSEASSATSPRTSAWTRPDGVSCWRGRRLPAADRAASADPRDGQCRRPDEGDRDPVEAFASAPSVTSS
jgi:hypothetical protein